MSFRITLIALLLVIAFILSLTQCTRSSPETGPEGNGHKIVLTEEQMQAQQKRWDSILEKKSKIRLGMTSDEVAKILGPYNHKSPLYEAVYYDADIVGYTWFYQKDPSISISKVGFEEVKNVIVIQFLLNNKVHSYFEMKDGEQTDWEPKANEMKQPDSQGSTNDK